MIKIRKGFFETNSSSTHCLTIWDDKGEIEKLYDIKFYYSYGDIANTPEEKIVALFDYLADVFPEHIDRFVKKLEELTWQDRSEIFEKDFFEDLKRSSYGSTPYWFNNDWMEKLYNKLDIFIFWNWIIQIFDNNISYYASHWNKDDSIFTEKDIADYESADFIWNNN